MKSKLTNALLATLILFSLSLHANEPGFVPDQLLVQVQEGSDFEAVVNKVRQQIPDLTIEREVSDHMNIWLVSFDPTANPMSEVHKTLYADDNVLVIQKNHLIKYRATTPNDPGYGSQWQYDNSGAGSASPNADLDADEAWDFGTGGTTALGDEIVVCVVDDGVDSDHEDWGDNLWKNEGEIPNNGIDDDNNGYIDDYKGWNPGSNSDDVDTGWAGGHGTPVAGIIGAQGNNGVGVTGVSWDVKVMIVQGGGDEASAIACYSYPLALRKMYNESGGEEGAFVVATNSSWGIDGGDPDSAPLWCAFYDTLGVHGILSAGATINGNQNVDVFGDLPTACSSEYLISVTNLDNSDNKVSFAGYGATTIDLGAYGEGTYTLTSGNGYGGFGGTSGATPHVAGAIGFLYSLECAGLADLALGNPALAAEQVRDAILDGVTPNESLSGITVTGGRLNLYNSALNVLDLDCGGCFSANGFEIQEAGLEAATIAWQTNGEVDGFNVRIRPTGSADWSDSQSTGLTTTFETLQACTEYEVQVQSLCAEEDSDFSNSYIFTTDGCCDAPMAMTPSVTETSLSLDFSSVTIASGYSAEISVSGTNQWQTIAVSGNSLNATGLESCTNYDIRLLSDCDGESSGPGDVITVRTDGCALCTLEYCESEDGDNSYEHISSISIGSFTNESGPGDSAFEVFSDEPIDIPIGEAIEIELSPGFSGFDYEERWHIFIDLNFDQSYDASEEVYFNNGSPTTIVDDFTIDADQAGGLTKMRIFMYDPNYSDVSQGCAGIAFGEIEEYCVNLIAACNIAAEPSITQPTCNGVPDGGILIEVDGNPSDYTFSWSGINASGNAAQNVASGNYSVIVDNGDCEVEVQVAVEEPDALVVESTDSQAATNGANGSATVDVDGGTGDYVYSWAGYPYDDAATLANVNAGTYDVEISDENGCSTTASIVVDCGIEIEAEITDPSCDGQEDGQITVSVVASGGAGNVSYDWSTGDTSAETSNNLGDGNYTVLVTDGDCFVEQTFEIQSPDPINFGVDSSDSDDNNNGTIEINAQGGSGNYTYTLNGETSATNLFEDLAPGSYEVAVSDENDCTMMDVVQISCSLTLDYNSNDVSCAGENDGDLNIVVLNSGGAGSFDYSWEDSDNNDESLEDLEAGTYSVTVTDGADCVQSISVDIVEPDALEIAAETESSTDGSDGSITLSVSGGTGTYTYDWTDLSHTGSSLLGLAAGTYTVEVSDENGCSDSLAITVDGANVGVEDGASKYLSAWPNPFDAELLLQSNEQVEYIRLSNVLGQKVYEKDRPARTLSIDCSHLPAGVYFLEFGIEGKTYTQKLMHK